MSLDGLSAQPLDAAAFSPFGAVLEGPAGAPGRMYFGPLLDNRRPAARLDLSLSHTPHSVLPVELLVMERHAHSAQAFLAIAVEAFLVVVAPGGDEGPDMGRALAFIAGAGQGLVYAPGTWHHPMVALGRPGRFAIAMWSAGDGADEEIRRLPAPVRVIG